MLGCPECRHGNPTWVCIIEQPDWRIYITPAFVFISTVVAVIALFSTRELARRKATLDLIEKVESTDHYRQLNSTFSRLRRGKGFAHLAKPVSAEDEADRAHVNDYLNHHELVSIGILHKILDEDFYKSWMRGPFVRDWNAAAEFVQRERWRREAGEWRYHPQIFRSYQQMAQRWSSEAINLTAQYGGPPTDIESGGPGDDPLPAAPNSDGG